MVGLESTAPEEEHEPSKRVSLEKEYNTDVVYVRRTV
jgi:hypothetical protein